MNSILVKFRRSEEFILIKTYDRQHGRSHHFYMSVETFSAWLMGDVGTFHDRDCLDFLSIHPESPETFYITLAWLSECSNGELNGYVQRFSIPKNVLLPLVRNEITEISYLAHTGRKPKVEITLSPNAHQNIKDMPPQIRRAFSRFMRDHFKYSEPCRVEIFADGKADFYFRDISPRGFTINGGIILSTVDRRYRNGTNFCHRYSMHT